MPYVENTCLAACERGRADGGARLRRLSAERRARRAAAADDDGGRAEVRGQFVLELIVEFELELVVQFLVELELELLFEQFVELVVEFELQFVFEFFVELEFELVRPLAPGQTALIDPSRPATFRSGRRS